MRRLNYEVEVGSKFGDWEVISASSQILADNRVYFRVKCKCGTEAYRQARHLHSGRTSMCKKCSSNLHWPKHLPPSNKQYVGDLTKTYFSCIVRGAVLRELEFSITQEEMWDILVKQDFKCALSNLPINLTTLRKDAQPDYSKFNASPDRIDNSKGYIKGNIQWLHKDINRMKNVFDNDYFIYICTQIANTHANQQPS